MRKLIVVALLGAGCAAPSQQTPVATGDAHIKKGDVRQRFALIPETNRTGIPWNGFFALDTETGQLCKTTYLVLKGDFEALPSCAQLSGAG
jgi:hypothetical protein